MAIKMSHYSATDRYCCLALDQVQLSQGLQYHLSLKQFVGNVSAELSGASKAEKKRTVPAKDYAIRQKELQENLTCL